MTAFHVSSAGAEDISRLSDWAEDEGWNPGRSDGQAFFPADPAGFLFGRLDGEPVASVSAVRYGADFGFVGLYIARPPFRGQGYGFRVWRAGLDHLAGRNVGLDGVVAQQENYRRSGFSTAWRRSARRVPRLLDHAAGPYRPRGRRRRPRGRYGPAA